MIEDSSDRDSEAPIKEFLRDLVTSLPIGLIDTLTSLSLFAWRVENAWDFNVNQTESELLSKISDLDFQHRTDSVNTDEVVDEVSSHFRRHHGLFRPEIPEVVVIISDGRKHSSSSSSGSWSGSSSSDTIKGDVVIVVNVGYEAINDGLFTDQATNSKHVIEEY